MQMIVSSCSSDPQGKNILNYWVVDCIDDVSYWMSFNRLKVNPTKTGFLWVATSRRQHRREEMTIGEASLTPSHCVKLFGLYIYNDLSLSSQISRNRQLWLQLRQKMSIRRCLYLQVLVIHCSMLSPSQDWTIAATYMLEFLISSSSLAICL